MELTSMIAWFIFSFFCSACYADFIMGVYHWAKDSYGTPSTPIIGPLLIWSSRLHHHRPRLVTEYTDWELFKSSFIWTMIWGTPYLYQFPSLPNVMLIIWIGLNDVIHKYAHMFDKERPGWITLLQKIKILQSYDEHHGHHQGEHDKNYCPITPYINPFLELINFWRVTEELINKYLGYEARSFEEIWEEDPTMPGGIRFTY